MQTAVQIRFLHPEMGRTIPAPSLMTEQSAGFDLSACVDDAVVLQPGERHLVPCGFAMALPPGWEAQVRPRSGLALKHGVTCLNSPGTIDADYRGQVHALLINLGGEPFTILPGMRVAQMVIAPLAQLHLVTVDELSETARGEGGFGSTGA